MAQGRKGKLNYRCPLCLRRDIDIDMLFDKEKDEYYCIRCSFTGKETQVQLLNAETRRRYADRMARITDFGPREAIIDSSTKRNVVPIEQARARSSKPDVKIRNRE